MQSGVTGVNAIRIYNVVKQSVDQDPHGVFIRRWVPELGHLNNSVIHTPWLTAQPQSGYPAPIVALEASTRLAKERIYGVKRQRDVIEAAKQVYEKHGSRNPAREGRSPTSRRKRASTRYALLATDVQDGLPQQRNLFDAHE